MDRSNEGNSSILILFTDFLKFKMLQRFFVEEDRVSTTQFCKLNKGK
jgi:hypothetical protein